MKFKNKKMKRLAVLLAIVILSTTSLVLAGIIREISEPHVSRDRTNVILTQDENNEDKVHVLLGMADDTSVASFQLGLDIDLIEDAEVNFTWSNSLTEDTLKKYNFQGEGSNDKRLNIYYVGTKELNTNDVDEIEIGTIDVSIPDDKETQFVITPDGEFSTIATIGHNSVKTAVEPTDILSVELNKKEIPITDLVLDPVEKTIELYEVFGINATIIPEDTTEDTTIAWSSSNESVAIVDGNGMVSGLGFGDTIITASVGTGETKIEKTCKVKVNEPKPVLRGIELNKAETTLKEGESEELTVRFIPDTVEYDGKITWASENTDIATVEDGMVKAKNEGVTSISATVTENGETYTAKCMVTVLPTLDRIELDKTELTLRIGAKETLNVKLIPENVAYEGELQWNSSNSDVASVENGLVTALSEGTTDISVTAKDGDNTYTATCVVTVVPVLKEVILDRKELTLKKGKTETLTYTLVPENVEITGTITWNSSNVDVATVTDSGEVKALSQGVTDITITVTDGDNTFSDKCVVTVVPVLEGVKLNKNELALNVEDSDTLTTSILPENYVYSGTYTWESSNPSVASVENGMVTALSEGTTNITVTVVDDEGNSFSDTCVVTARVALESIELNKHSATLKVGQREELSIRFMPEEFVYEGTYTWNSSNEGVATVTDKGEVKAVSEGTADITVTVEDAGNTFTDKCTITVEKLDEGTIEIDEDDFELSVGHSLDLDVLGDIEGEVVWSSSDENVATVDQDGNVYAKSEGKATIKVKVNDKEATVEVTVKFVEVKRVYVEVEKDTLNPGEDTKLNVSFYPEDASLPIEYEIISSDENVVTVDENGTIYAHNPGHATITVRTSNGVEKQIEITVLGEVTENNENTSTDESVNTGDIPVWLFVVLGVVAVAGIVFVIVRAVSNSKKNK